MFCFFFFNDTATTEIYTLSLHDALPISPCSCSRSVSAGAAMWIAAASRIARWVSNWPRSEEHTSELQSQSNLVCRLLLEKKTHSHRQSGIPSGSLHQRLRTRRQPNPTHH